MMNQPVTEPNWQAIEAAEQHRRDIEALMRPGRAPRTGRVTDTNVCYCGSGDCDECMSWIG